MKVTLSKYAGFCDGVERAYEMVKKIAKDPKIQKPIYVLGSLVHNEDVVNSIEKLGVKKIEFNGKIGEIMEKIDDKIGTLVVTAHGIGPKIFEIAKQRGIDIVDTTCPKVIKAQRLAEVFYKRSHQIIIIGKRKHKETMGIFRWARKRASVVESGEDVNNLNFSAESEITVISQTTQNKDRVDKIIERILKKYPEAKIIDTVCDTTKRRQMEAKILAQENDVVLVIGSPDSSNSTELWNIAKKINSNSYFIERMDDVKKHWFVGCQNIGITAGASSPKWVISEIQKYLTSYK